MKYKMKVFGDGDFCSWWFLTFFSRRKERDYGDY